MSFSRSFLSAFAQQQLKLQRFSNAKFRRNYSVDASLSEEEMTKQGMEVAGKWIKIIVPGAIGLGLLSLYEYLVLKHPHPIVEYPYNNIRTKPFPFGDGNHSLFGGKHPGQFHRPEFASEDSHGGHGSSHGSGHDSGHGDSHGSGHDSGHGAQKGGKGGHH